MVRKRRENNKKLDYNQWRDKKKDKKKRTAPNLPRCYKCKCWLPNDPRGIQNIHVSETGNVTVKCKNCGRLNTPTPKQLENINKKK